MAFDWSCGVINGRGWSPYLVGKPNDPGRSGGNNRVSLEAVL